MKDGIKVSTILPNGVKVEYYVVLTFQSIKSGKHYCIYTDNTYDQNQKLRFYAAIYDPNLDNPFLGEPMSGDEWRELMSVVDSVIPVS